MREYEVAYVAGVLDSDGYVTIHKNIAKDHPVYSPRIGINQIDFQAIELAQKLFGGGLSVNKTDDRYGRRPLFAWFLGSNGLVEALRELIPYLRIKKEKARIALALQENIREWKKIKAIKGHSGIPVYPLEVYAFREKCWQELRNLSASSVAETKSESVGSKDSNDAIVRTPNEE